MFLDFMGALQQHQSCCNIAGTFLWGAISTPCRPAGPPQPSVAGMEWQRHLIKGIKSKTESGWSKMNIAFSSCKGEGLEGYFLYQLIRATNFPRDGRRMKHWSIYISIRKWPMKKQFITSVMTVWYVHVAKWGCLRSTRVVRIIILLLSLHVIST